ncbi:hypothetical protein ACFPOB_27295 [Bosea eneae]|uniref:Uncharacterized protein n=1 Tax=Bosea eneae TaxID=151454 RepID=A0ABW0J165_9HYPH
MVAIITGAFAVFGGRSKARIEHQQVINAGFTTLLAEHRKDTDQLRDLIRELRATDEAQSDLIERLESERSRLATRVLDLEAQLRRAGVRIAEPRAITEI